jgi:hypothetical protein
MKILKTIYDFIKDFIKKNWKYLFIVPVACAIYRWFKNIEPTRPNIVKDHIELTHNVNILDRKADESISRIDRQADNEKNGVDSGNPTPAQIFDKEIKK